VELEHYQKIALYGFLVAMVFGAIANRTHFCTMGAISDWVNMGSRTRFRVWLLAMGVAIVGTQWLSLSGMVDLSGTIYYGTSFTWLGYILGGFLFGIGMTIGSGCGQRTLVRVGSGNLKSLVLLLVLAITAYMTLRGLLALLRIEINEPTTIDLAEKGLPTQSFADIISAITGLSPSLAGIVLTILVGGGVVFYALRDRKVRGEFDNLLAGVGVGLVIVAAWYITGVLGFDDFEPIAVEGVSFISPVGNTLTYLMTYTGSTINFGIALVLGTIAGSFLYSLFAGTLRIESFNDHGDLLNHLYGGVLMGFGGVLSLGCTIGQGITGMSTLAPGSLLALLSIIGGCVVTLKMQYYLYDEEGVWHAVKCTAADLLPSR
jgi:uncharacterized membrane protein YedE/YeeE